MQWGQPESSGSSLNPGKGNSDRVGLELLRAAASVVEQQGRWALGIGQSGHIIYASDPARKALAAALDMTMQTVAARFEESRSKIDQIMHGLSSGRGSPPVTVSRGPGKTPFVLRATKLPQPPRELTTQTAALLIFSDPDEPLRASPDLLIDYLGITKSEARLAIAILNGQTLEQHARDSGTTIVTARNHLQNLQGKTGTNSMASLVALLCRILPV
jgi:DNA-binding CsgD family transcriptional regulator